MNISYENITDDLKREAEPIIQKVGDIIGANDAGFGCGDTDPLYNPGTKFESIIKIHQLKDNDIHNSVEVFTTNGMKILRYVIEDMSVSIPGELVEKLQELTDKACKSAANATLI